LQPIGSDGDSIELEILVASREGLPALRDAIETDNLKIRRSARRSNSGGDIGRDTRAAMRPAFRTAGF